MVENYSGIKGQILSLYAKIKKKSYLYLVIGNPVRLLASAIDKVINRKIVLKHYLQIKSAEKYILKYALRNLHFYTRIHI